MAEDDEPQAWKPSNKRPAGESSAESDNQEFARPGPSDVDPENRIYESAASVGSEQLNFEESDFENFGYDLATVMAANGYHPVILFGTNNSGKTSLLMSLFGVLRTESDRLQTGMKLGAPLLGLETELGRQLHANAKRLFEIGTQSFLRGEEIPATKTQLPFFIPVEFAPKGEGKPAVRFAFLESNGEWYRPLQQKGQKLSELTDLYPQLRPQIEQVVERFQGGMSFIYVAPFTQGKVYAPSDDYGDVANLESASQALVGVLKAYETARQGGGRPFDKHLMLVTKWDKRAAGALDRAKEIEEDREDLEEFFATTYMQAHAEFTSIGVREDQKALNSYCSGIMGEKGLLPLGKDEDTKHVVTGYPIRLWTWLYKNALENADPELAPVEPFPSRRGPPAFVLWLRGVLDAISGGSR